MSSRNVWLCACLLLFCCVVPMWAQQAVSAPSGSNEVVPPLVSFSGKLTDLNGKPLTGVAGAMFALYKDAQGGAPLWLEMQNVYPDKTGHYAVMLGSTTSTGLPSYLFVAGEARWLGVQPQGQAEQPRILLLSVPYALKAADAETLGGKPASAYILAAPGGAAATTSSSSAATKAGGRPNVAGTGTQNYVPLWLDNAGTLGNSVLYQSGSGSTAKVGINTTAPSATLGVNGSVSATSFNIAGNRFAFGTYKSANAFLGFAGNSTMTGAGNTAVGDRGLFNNTTGSSNTASGDSALQGNTAGSFNTASGYVALTSNNTGTYNTANGVYALYLNATGAYNTASGAWTLNNNNGSYNTTIGMSSLSLNTTGSYNTASGYEALQSNTTGNYNTALGVGAGPDTSSPNLTNATAIGANAVVSESNALVLGGLGTNAVNVGIGTATPAYTLDVRGTGNFTGPVTFASGQAFPGAASLGANTFTGNQTVNGNLSATGLVTGTAFNIGSNLFDFGSYANQNAFSGFAGNSATVVQGNTGVGYQALYSNVGDTFGDGWYNTALGTSALYSNNNTSGKGFYAYGNTAIGWQALYSNTTGNSNTASGWEALRWNTTGIYNTAFGGFAATNSNSGNENTAIGYAALDQNTGNSNTALGSSALFWNSTGTNNTAAGYYAGRAADGSYIAGSGNTFLGNWSAISTGTLNNATAIGAFAYVTQSNTLVLGSIAGVNGATASTNVGIGTTAPDNLLTVNGSADKPGGGSWGTYSDRRLKTVKGSFNSGLSQILKLHPVLYRYNKENALGIRDAEEHVGLVAQDVQKVIPEAVTENNRGYLLLNNDPILWSMLNAIKEQQALIHEQQEQIVRLSRQVKTIQATLKTNGRSGSAIRTVKAEGAPARQ